MKYLKIAKTVSLSLVVGVFLSACVDLALEPHESVSEDAYLRSMGDFRAAIVGGYNNLSSSSYYGRNLPLLADVMGEDVKQNGSSGRSHEFADFEGLNPTGHNYEEALWAAAYEGINMANMMINSAFEPPAAVQAEFDQIIGEAHAVRALSYFDLVRMYAQHYTFTADASHAGVPLVLVHDVTGLPARTTVAEVYNQIISDFNTAIGLMTMTRAGPYMFTKEATQALLSRVYLYMEDFSTARTMADAVIDSGKYSLVTGAAYVTQFATGGSSEAVFEIKYTETDNPGSDCLGCMYRATGYGDFLPAKDLLDLIDPADIRMQMFKEDPLLTGIYASMRVDKWPTATQTDNTPVIRLSEVYLNRAEANARSGQDAAAQADLNLIRQRGLATAPDVTLTGQDLLDEILIERRIELGYEGHRIFDITRHRLDVVRIDCTGDVCFYPYPGPFVILPIPFQELAANPNITQNPGY